MSVEAITWALKQPVPNSSTKFVLVILANCASAANSTAFPSVAYIAQATGQNRKTVLAGLRRLIEAGLIEDAQERRGETKQIIVYKLCVEAQGNETISRERHYCYRIDDPESGRFYIGVRSCAGDPALDGAYRGTGKWPQELRAGGVAVHKEVLSIFTSRLEAEKMERVVIEAYIDNPLCMNETIPPKPVDRGILANSPENGTVKRVPKSAGNSTENGTKQSLKRDTEPSDTSETSKAYGTRGKRLPLGWVVDTDLQDWATSHGHTEAHVNEQAEMFRDHWKAATGKGSTKADWNAAFRNWLRNSVKNWRTGNANHTASGGKESAADRVARINRQAESRH